MRRVRRSIWSKLHAENTAHPLSQHPLPPRAPASAGFLPGGKIYVGRGDFLPFFPGRPGKVCESYDDHS